MLFCGENIQKKKLVVCMTGATGSIYGYRLMLACSKIQNLETHAVVTSSAGETLRIELGITAEEVLKNATFHYREDDFTAPIASGSYNTDGMVVAPCSMKTLSSIATGFEQNLVARAAMVALKERRPLILLTRESPLNAIHLHNMLAVNQAGGTIMPPLPPFYFGMKSIENLVDITVGRVLNMLGIETKMHKQWGVD